LRRAAVLAMRYAAALVILQMDKATGISALSQASRDGQAARPPAGGDPPDAETLHTTATEGPLDDSG
jgi:hypothetical protein